MPKTIKNDELSLVVQAKHHNPHSVLGLHVHDGQHSFRAFLPHAHQVWLKLGHAWEKLTPSEVEGFFEWSGPVPPESPCQLRIEQHGQTIETWNPYSFGPMLSNDELYLLGEGRLKLAYRTLGAHLCSHQGVAGVRFAVWAPTAERVSVVGDFNQWDGRVHAMHCHGSSGVWELFIPQLTENQLYKFEIRNRNTGHLHIKTDPYGFSFEALPGTASKVTRLDGYQWQDDAWLKARAERDWLHAPLNCYEVHLGSWRRDEHGHFLGYRQLAEQLIPYVQDMGYTHIELLPISEHPLNESWGYQTTGYFGITNRFGSPDDFRYFVDRCHQAGIGVILDWVPGHFPKDDWALARFDGSALYEHEDPRLGEHQDWGTYIFNYGRNEVRNFLISNAYYWLKELHIDGLRVDAVASMLYLDYSRKEGEWLPNKFGGRENLDVIDFLRQLNMMVHEDFPGALTIAEESTSFPMVSRPVYLGGLGFSMKWNMGWMNDTLSYMGNDPIHRRYHQQKLTFGQLYAYTENFLLPFSHDEVVHGKRSLLEKMPGDSWQKFANLRLLMAYQATISGKKLSFMGNEIGQSREWNVNASLDWQLLGERFNQGIQRLCRDLNHAYKNYPALHALDFEQAGFHWIDCNDAEQSTISFVRSGRAGETLVILLNFTPVPRMQYRIGVPHAGVYRELINTDAECYGGSNLGNGGLLHSEAVPWMGCQHSIELTLPPLAGLILQPESA
ncbi:MAG TPA: 1,4-alpha-glucan branching protein GlgB [Methylovorus sp.]|nr:1,4-alpha-glucan branching protein GlgB [Methylovorus sp.]